MELKGTDALSKLYGDILKRDYTIKVTKEDGWYIIETFALGLLGTSPNLETYKEVNVPKGAYYLSAEGITGWTRH